jgi:hypothetical protein
VVLLRRFCPLFYRLVRTSNIFVRIVFIRERCVYAVADLKAGLGWQSIDVDMGLVKSILWEKPLSTNDHTTLHPPNNLLNLAFVWDSSHIPLVQSLLRFNISSFASSGILQFRSIRSLGGPSNGGALIYFCSNKKSTRSSPSVKRVTPSSLSRLLIILFPCKSRASPLVDHITHDIDA